MHFSDLYIYWDLQGLQQLNVVKVMCDTFTTFYLYPQNLNHV